jgi:two-component system cell cycle response regulator DivK
MAILLLVEDNEINRDMLSRRLERRGYQVLVAVDGVQGIALARIKKPDLILMDMSLPAMDGWEATQRLRSWDETRTIPIIGLTAHALSSDRERAMKAGCNEYETKPVNFSRLLAKIEMLVSG